MSLIRKISSIGIDKIVDKIQVKMDSSTFLSGFTWDNFPRAYKNPKSSQRTFIPEVYDENGEYIEVLMSDKVQLTTFFVQNDSSDYLNTQITSDLSLIVQCSELDGLFPSIEHRADEELKHKFLNVLKNIPEIKINTIETGIPDVYREFDTTNLKLDDMGAFFVFRVNMTVNYELACCTNC